MEYLHWWRMLIAKDMLARSGMSLSQIARRVGYGSASAFGTAFNRHAGTSPARYASQLRS